MDGEVAALEVRDDRLVGVRLVDGSCVPRQVLVVASRLAARGDLTATLGLSLSDARRGDLVIGTHLAADATGATDVPGVWVAGNATDPLAQVITAAAAGLTTGAAVNADLLTEETRLAVAAYQSRTPDPAGDPGF